MLIYPCCWCSHGYGCVDGLCRISCLTESGKQRQEGELGFIFIPQPGILTEREEACCLVSFPFCARKSGNFKFPFLPLFTSSFFFSKILQEKSRNGSSNRIFSRGSQHLGQGLPVSPSLQGTCQGGCTLSLGHRTCLVVPQGVTIFCTLLPQPGRSVPPAFPGRNVPGEVTQLAKVGLAVEVSGMYKPQLC